MKKKANLYTSASLNASWLLISIDTALWLYKSDGFKKITINCISNYNPINLFNLLLRLKNLSSYLNKSKFKKLWKFLKSSKIKNSTKTNLSDLASFATGKTDKAFLKIDDLEIILIRKKLIKKKSIINSIFLSYITIKDYINYFSKSALKSKKYLEYKVDNIFSGLHIMSESLRTDYKSCGSVFKCRLGILTTIYKLHKFVKEYKQLNLEKENKNFVIGPAQEYIYGFFSRFMTEQGACYIDNTGKQKSYVKRQLNDKYFSRLKIIPQEKYLNIDKKKISDYYQLRIQKPWDVFDDIYFLKQNYSSNNGLSN